MPHPHTGMPVAERFFLHVDKTDACWNWTATKNAKGYGSLRINTKSDQAHRWSYEHSNGPIPDGLQIDHLCRNTSCVNPEHMEPVTAAENLRRRFALITHCSKGHEFSPDNTRIYRGTQRRCIACERFRDKQRTRP